MALAKTIKNNVEMSWEKVRLGDVVFIKTGKLDANSSSENGEFPFFTCSKEPLKISSYSYDTECVLVAGNGDLNVKYFKGKFDAYQRTYIIEVQNENVLLIKYLYYFIDTCLVSLREKSIGGVIKYIKLENLTELLIPLPPLATQKRIADILDTADALRRKDQELLTKYDQLAQAIFIDMFGDPVKNEKGWEVKKLGEILDYIKDGPHVSPKYTTEGIPFISVNNIIKGTIDLSNCKYISIEDFLIYSNKGKPEKDDILYTKGGTTGFAKRVDIDIDFMQWVHVALLKFDKKILNSIFLEQMLNSNYCYHQSQLLTKGIANRDLVLGEIKKIKILFPPITEQIKFAEKIKLYEKLKFTNINSVSHSTSLFSSLIQQAFNGTLVS